MAQGGPKGSRPPATAARGKRRADGGGRRAAPNEQRASSGEAVDRPSGGLHGRHRRGWPLAAPVGGGRFRAWCANCGCFAVYRNARPLGRRSPRGAVAASPDAAAALTTICWQTFMPPPQRLRKRRRLSAGATVSSGDPRLLRDRSLGNADPVGESMAPFPCRASAAPLSPAACFTTTPSCTTVDRRKNPPRVGRLDWRALTGWSGMSSDDFFSRPMQPTVLRVNARYERLACSGSAVIAIRPATCSLRLTAPGSSEAAWAYAERSSPEAEAIRKAANLFGKNGIGRSRP